MFCLRTLRELKLLKFLSEAGVSENVSPSVIRHIYALSQNVQDHFNLGHYQASLPRRFQRSLLCVQKYVI